MNNEVRQALLENWRQVGIEDQKRLAKQSAPKDTEGIESISYLNDSNPAHTLDIWWPKGTTGLLPTLIDVHGGGWAYGSSSLISIFARYLAKHGVAVVVPNYRLLPETDLKGQIQDLFSALHWLSSNAHQYHCDLNNIAITGDSAGAHLCSLLTAIDLDPSLLSLYQVTKLSFSIHAVVGNHGVYDLSQGLMGDSPISKEYDCMFFGDKAKNPIYEKSALIQCANAKTYPRMLVITSEADGIKHYSYQLMAFLKDNGFSYEVFIPNQKNYPRKLGHEYNVTYPHYKISKETNDKLIHFCFPDLK